MTKNVCGQCKKPSETKCSRCKLVYYCERACQKKHWRIHKKECVIEIYREPLEELQDEEIIEAEGESIPTEGLVLSVEVAKSNIHGNGVFATKPIYLGDRICFFNGHSKDASIKVRMRRLENKLLSINESEKVFLVHDDKGKDLEQLLLKEMICLHKYFAIKMIAPCQILK